MVNSPMEDGNPMLSADGRLLVFTSNRTGGPGGFDLFMATRKSPTAVLGNVARIAELSMSGDESEPYLSADGKELWFNRSAATGPGDIFHSVAQAGGWGPPVAVAELNSTADETLPVISADGGTIYFASNRDGKVAGIWKASRAHATDPFSLPTKVTELEAAVEQHPSWLSLDGCRLYYSRGHDPSRMYIASKPR